MFKLFHLRVQVKCGFQSTDFYRTHKSSTALCGDQLQRISHRWVKNNGESGHNILTSFLFRLFDKIPKATYNLVMSVRPSRLSARMEQLGPPIEGFS